MHSTKEKIDFNNTALAFQHYSDKELKRLYRLFRLIDSPFLTRIGPGLVEKSLSWGLPVEPLLRKTLYEIFCGGPNLEASLPTLNKLDSNGVKTILDYSVEGEKNERGFETTFDELYRSIEFGGREKAVSFVALKVSGLGDVDLLAKLQAGSQLTPSEQEAFQRIKKRLSTLCEASVNHDLPVFIDAEESWIQGPVDEMVEELMAAYNTDKAYVYTTVQLYRHDRLAYLKKLLKGSETRHYIPGIKLVRGAYLEKENERAEEWGYPTPIQPTKAATDADFNTALELCIQSIEQVAICAGTHNEASSMLLVELMEKHGLAPNHTHICFAQLLGMSNHISFNLAAQGYRTAKYVPYGPVKAVIPYLMRRANENTAIAGQSSREVELLRKEVKRRRL
ncbi:MAG: proline dehydrogenase family protein [Bacteroidota bacterium]